MKEFVNPPRSTELVEVTLDGDMGIELNGRSLKDAIAYLQELLEDHDRYEKIEFTYDHHYQDRLVLKGWRVENDREYKLRCEKEKKSYDREIGMEKQIEKTELKRLENLSKKYPKAAKKFVGK